VPFGADRAHFFQGVSDLAARAARARAMLRKDFVIDAYQVFESRAPGRLQSCLSLPA